MRIRIYINGTTNITTREVLGISVSYAFFNSQNYRSFRKYIIENYILHMIYKKIHMCAQEATF